MSNVGLINWSGHNNLGDDAMAQILLENIPGAVNMKETPWDADWYILGGGTLISPQSLYPGRLPNPEKTIGISLGVSSNWNGENAEIYRRMKKIYTRDYFSHRKLLNCRIPNELSVDLLCFLEPQGEVLTDGIWANIMYAPESINPFHKDQVSTVSKELELDQNINYFAMSPDEDLQTKPNAYVYTKAQLLINDLQGASKVYATRLHANIAAWVSGVTDIVPLCYDPKIEHFYERVKDITPSKAREIIHKHLKEVCELVS